MSDPVSINNQPKTPPPAPQAQMATRDMQRQAGDSLNDFLRTGAAMLEEQRRNVQDLQSAYVIERTRLEDGFRVRLENLRHEANTTLREYDERHVAAMENAAKLHMLLGAVQELGS